MTEPITPGLTWASDACTLPTAERPLRKAEFDAVFAAAHGRGQRLSATRLRLSVAGGSDLEATIRDLAARETACCSFFTFTVGAPEAGRVRLDIEVPPAHIEVLDAIAARIDAVGTAA
jgi:hypothetical protein